MCRRIINGPYPCGHETVTWEYCSQAKGLAVVKLSKCVKPCRGHESVQTPADLESPCSSTCLTRPFRCHNCRDAANQVTWRCRFCHHVRCADCKYWDECATDGCGRIAFGNGGAVCDECRQRTAPLR